MNAVVWWQSLLLVMLGGAFGSGLRFVIGSCLLQRFGAGFPWGTLAVNLIGSFVAGFLLIWVDKRGIGGLVLADVVDCWPDWRANDILLSDGGVFGVCPFRALADSRFLLMYHFTVWFVVCVSRCAAGCLCL